MKHVSLIAVLFVSLLVFACGSDSDDIDATELLVSMDWLTDNLDNSDVQIVDIRQTTDGYAAGHITGAIQLDFAAIRAEIDGVPGQVPSSDVVANAFSAAGLQRDATIVVYDNEDGLFAARLVWTLQYYGHSDVRLLNGDFEVWNGAGRDVSTTATTPDPTTYSIDGAIDELRVDAEWIKARLDDSSVAIVDARTPDEYAAGHIPGAINHNWTTNVDNGMFKARDTLLDKYSDIPKDKTVVTYCRSGVRSAIAFFVLRYLGYEDVRNYDGSWHEWGNPDNNLPIETD